MTSRRFSCRSAILLSLLLATSSHCSGAAPIPRSVRKADFVLARLTKHSFWSVAFSPDGKYLAAGADNGIVTLWNVRTWRKEIEFAGTNEGRIWTLTFSPDSKRLLMNSQGVMLWDVKTGKRLSTLGSPRSGCVGAAFSPDGKSVAVVPFDVKHFHLWDSATGKLLRKFTGHNYFVWQVAFSPDGKQLASASRDKTIRVCNPHTGALLRTLSGPEEFWGITYSPDGKRLAGSMHKYIGVWDTTTGRQIWQIKGHEKRIFNLEFSADGSKIVTGSYDKLVKLWDAKTGQELTVFRGHTQRIHKVAIHPNGSILASASRDGTVRIWAVKRGRQDK